MLPMHYHPRGSNYVYSVFGTTHTFMIQENGAGVVQQVLPAGKMTIFPQASLHMMMNIGEFKSTYLDSPHYSSPRSPID